MKKTRFFMAFLLIVTLLAFTGCANDGADMGTNDNGTNGTKHPVENGINDVENGVRNGVDDMTNNNNDGMINNNTTNGGVNNNMNDVAK